MSLRDFLSIRQVVTNIKVRGILSRIGSNLREISPIRETLVKVILKDNICHLVHCIDQIRLIPYTVLMLRYRLD